jgi:hypothetical protein
MTPNRPPKDSEGLTHEVHLAKDNDLTVLIFSDNDER